jgi:two-component system nitrogen regulation response regulator GlnG
VAGGPPAVVILDLSMPGLDGLETLSRLKALAPPVPVIILTGHGDVPSAVEAMRLGAYDYLTKPIEAEPVLIAVRRALERRELGAEIDQLRSTLRERGPLRWLMGRSPQIRQVIQQIRQVADSTLTIVIQGETGTGKELVARSIHQLSARRHRPFVALDCGAIPETLIESELFGHERGAFTGAVRRKEGHFQLAEGGTLFLDEVANLPGTTQAKLLRVIQEREVHLLGGTQVVPVDVRIIAASNVPLDREVQAGRFRQDLYYRLNEFIITVPPLRERRDDVVYLAELFRTEACTELRRPDRGITEEALQVLLRHPWPGNVRELRNVLRRAVLMSSGRIRPEHLTVAVNASATPAAAEEVSPSAGRSLRQAATTAAAAAERQAIEWALRATRGNKTEAARLLRTDFKTLHLKMKRYGIQARQFRAS